MKIRSFKPTDAEKVSKLSNDNLTAFQRKVSPSFLRKISKNPDFKLFVLADGSEILGFCGLNFERIPLAEMGPLCIESSRRAQGLGRALVDDVFSFAKEIGVNNLIIKVKSSNNAAQDFFASVGFAKIDEGFLGDVPIVIMKYEME
jgi:predicted GNAT superfamily acetyltransferase